jgi:hypothetical protein
VIIENTTHGHIRYIQNPTRIGSNGAIYPTPKYLYKQLRNASKKPIPELQQVIDLVGQQMQITAGAPGPLEACINEQGKQQINISTPKLDVCGRKKWKEEICHIIPLR